MLFVCYGLYKIGLGTGSECSKKISIESKTIAYWDSVKWISRYLRRTTDYDIMFSRQYNDPSVVGYVDADYARDSDDRRSTIGYVFTLCG